MSCVLDCLLVTGLIIIAVTAVVVLLYLSSTRRKYSIKGKHILITGGSSGIGKAIALEALKRGVDHVTLIARNKAKLHSVKEELNIICHQKQSVDIISADVSETGVEDQIRKSLSNSPPVDVVINSAGITHTGSFIETGRDVFQSLFNTNVLGSVSVIRAVLPMMTGRRTGHIVFVSSQAGQFPMYGYTAYSSTKFALRGLAEVLDMELRPYNVRVSISFPPDTDTPQLQDELKQRSTLVKELATYSTTLKPQQIACEILTGVERQQFSIYHSFDGFMLKTLTSGASPSSSLWELLTQVVTMGLFRLVAVGYLFQFNRIVGRSLKKNS